MTNGFLNLVDVLYKSGEYIEIGGGQFVVLMDGL